MNILIGCEESAKVRDAFRKRGHDAWSCDILPTRGDPEWHIQDDIMRAIHCYGPWDLMIAFPPCTHLAVSGARWLTDHWVKRGKGRYWYDGSVKREAQRQAIAFFMAIAEANIPRIAIENPIGVMSTRWRKPDQIIQPWQFGHGEVKATCLWLKNLPKLTPTNVVSGREPRIWKMTPGENRARDRSETYQGIADAMADQWGNL